MEARHFDRLTRALSEAGPRRGLLGLLAGLPVLGGLVALLDPEETDAHGRRHRRKKAHKHGRGRRRKRHKKKTCKAHSTAKTCAGKCGPVTNNCQKTVDCGSCACDPPCDECFVCNEDTRTCEVDSDQVGDPCGEPGQVCQADGACACDDGSCPSCTTCGGDGTCQGCSGCCAGTTCVPGTSDSACGTGGAACVTCTSPDTCGGGDAGTPGVCGCTPTTCAAQGKNCGSISDGCGGMLDCGSCGPCQMCTSAGQCVADPGQNRTTCDGSGTATSVCCNGECCTGCCGRDGSCGACRVFVTSKKYDGNLKGSSASGLAGADDKCQQLAGSVDPPLPGTYNAWLSDSTDSPSTRFRCTAASCSTHGYVLVDGTTVVATDWDDLTTCDPGNGPCLDHVIDHTEQNVLIGSQNAVWTHTNTDGTAGGQGNVHCLEWSTNDPGQSGDEGTPIAGHGDATWTRFLSLVCNGGNGGARLYCFQQS